MAENMKIIALAPNECSVSDYVIRRSRLVTGAAPILPVENAIRWRARKNVPFQGVVRLFC